MTYSEFKSHLADYVEKICAGSTSLRVTLKDGRSLRVALDKPQKKPRKKKMDETEYLLSNPANARHLMEAFENSRHPERLKTYRSVDEVREEFGIK